MENIFFSDSIWLGSNEWLSIEFPRGIADYTVGEFVASNSIISEYENATMKFKSINSFQIQSHDLNQ